MCLSHALITVSITINNHMSSKSKSTSLDKSVIRKFKDQNRIDDETLVVINSFTIEDLLAIKLELSANNLNNRLYGLDIWKKSGYIIKDAMLKFAVSTTKSKKDASRFLGIPYAEFNSLYKKYELEDFFNNE